MGCSHRQLPRTQLNFASNRNSIILILWELSVFELFFRWKFGEKTKPDRAGHGKRRFLASVPNQPRYSNLRSKLGRATPPCLVTGSGELVLWHDTVITQLVIGILGTAKWSDFHLRGWCPWCLLWNSLPGGDVSSFLPIFGVLICGLYKCFMVVAKQLWLPTIPTLLKPLFINNGTAMNLLSR